MPYFTIMTELTVTAKGQITLRKELLAHLGLKPGDKVKVEPQSDGSVSIRPRAARHHISAVFGMLKRPGQPTLTIDEINEAARKGWAGELEDLD